MKTETPARRLEIEDIRRQADTVIARAEALVDTLSKAPIVRRGAFAAAIVGLAFAAGAVMGMRRRR